eukprot:scaffold64772_cov46-Phaeocystis_antarctica.AAC.1
MTAESMCTICRLSARCLPLEPIDRNVAVFLRDLAGYHPLSSKSRARSCLSRLARAGAAPRAPRRTRHTRDEIEAYVHSGIMWAAAAPVYTEATRKR